MPAKRFVEKVVFAQSSDWSLVIFTATSEVDKARLLARERTITFLLIRSDSIGFSKKSADLIPI